MIFKKSILNMKRLFSKCIKVLIIHTCIYSFVHEYLCISTHTYNLVIFITYDRVLLNASRKSTYIYALW